MASDTSAGETETCSSDLSTEEKPNTSLTASIDFSIKEDSNDTTEAENTSETLEKTTEYPDDCNTDVKALKFVVSDPIHIEVPQDDDVSREVVTKNDSKSALLDIHDIQIIDDLPDKQEPLKNNSNDAFSISDGSCGEKSADETDMPNDSISKKPTIVVNDDDVVTSNSGITLNPNNVMLLNPKNNITDKQILSNDLLKGQRVFILNGNVISKEEVEKTKPDNINIICVSNNLGDIITNMKGDAVNSASSGKSVLTSEATDRSVIVKSIEKIMQTHQSAVPTITANGPKFIQITQGNYKPITPKISVSTGSAPMITIPKMIAPKPTALIANVSNEILRTKLFENEVTSTSPTQITESSPVVKKPTSLGVMKKENEVESPAIARARNEFNKCRKKLIEAAIHPQLPTYKPPVTYEGPIYSCEECDDTFSCTDSLKNHKNRRSVLFTYNCPPCNCTLEFYNRCTFLLHVRSHDAAVKACYLTISTIPSDKLNFKLLQQDEVETEIPQHPEKPVQRAKERVPSFRINEENNDSAPKTDIKENGTDKSKPVSNSSDKNGVLRNFDFIKSLRKNKFEAYLQNTDRMKKFAAKKPVEKKSESESSMSDDSSDDENESVTSQETSNDTSSLNGSAGTSQLKYFLTTNDHTINSPLKRPTENNQPSTEETANKKRKVHEPLIKDAEPRTVSESSKIKHTPTIIRAKPGPLKPDSAVEKPSDEIALRSSSDEEDESEMDDNSEENKTVICRECRTEVTNLNKHIRAENKPLKKFLCELCKFFSPTQCAMTAHMRMHSKSQPYICPDCGFYFNTYETFQTHIKQVCYYDYKSIRFECPECSLLKPSVQAFSDHLKRCHTRDVFKCSLCITSSYSTKVVEIHMKKKHVGEEGSVLEGYRCMLCPNILISKKSIDTHISKHVFSLKHLRYVYICKRCKKYATGKRNKFVLHMNECEEKKKENTVKPKDKEKTASSKSVAIKTMSTGKPRRSRPSKSPGKKDVIVVEEKDPLSVEDWEADKLKAQYVPKTKICVMCRSADISSRSNSLFCNTCVCSVNADDTASESSEGRHDSGRPKRKFKCRLCKQFMNKDWATITKHYEQNHYSDLNAKSETKSRQPKDKETESKKSDKPDKSEKFDHSTPVNIIKKRRLSTKDVPVTKSPKIEEIIIPTSSPPSSYKCVNCAFSVDSREEFQTHIVTHKDPNHIQCPECGECFVVGTTLAKHLLIKHDVRNLRKYFIENNLMKKEDLPECRKVLENQCEVCLMKLDTKQNYDKHIRTHGMAFVALQSRAKDDKSPRG